MPISKTKSFEKSVPIFEKPKAKLKFEQEEILLTPNSENQMMIIFEY